LSPPLFFSGPFLGSRLDRFFFLVASWSHALVAAVSCQRASFLSTVFEGRIFVVFFSCFFPGLEPELVGGRRVFRSRPDFSQQPLWVLVSQVRPPLFTVASSFPPPPHLLHGPLSLRSQRLPPFSPLFFLLLLRLGGTILCPPSAPPPSGCSWAIPLVTPCPLFYF